MVRARPFLVDATTPEHRAAVLSATSWNALLGGDLELAATVRTRCWTSTPTASSTPAPTYCSPTSPRSSRTTGRDRHASRKGSRSSTRTRATTPSSPESRCSSRAPGCDSLAATTPPRRRAPPTRSCTPHERPGTPPGSRMRCSSACSGSGEPIRSRTRRSWTRALRSFGSVPAAWCSDCSSRSAPSRMRKRATTLALRRIYRESIVFSTDRGTSRRWRRQWNGIQVVATLGQLDDVAVLAGAISAPQFSPLDSLPTRERTRHDEVLARTRRLSVTTPTTRHSPTVPPCPSTRCADTWCTRSSRERELRHRSWALPTAEEVGPGLVLLGRTDDVGLVALDELPHDLHARIAALRKSSPLLNTQLRYSESNR